ncbi:MAG: 16S rRNA (guanine(966)-N(2))-methyltransferase RsmD [Planctomycetota bacterium]
MRIISGQWRGRRLQAPDGLVTRPMLGRVREALFSSLGDRVDGARVLDLYAGTGSLGLEALSRGAAHVRFVEQDRKVQSVLKANIAALGAEPSAEVRGGDALAPNLWQGEPWDIVFLDPPYPLLHSMVGRRQIVEAVKRLATEYVFQRSILVLHTEPRQMNASDLQGPWDLRSREYGRTVLWYIEPQGGDE